MRIIVSVIHHGIDIASHNPHINVSFMEDHGNYFNDHSKGLPIVLRDKGEA